MKRPEWGINATDNSGKACKQGSFLYLEDVGRSGFKKFSKCTRLCKKKNAALWLTEHYKIIQNKLKIE